MSEDAPYRCWVVRVALIGDSHLTDTSSRGVTKLGPRLRRHGHPVQTLAIGGMDTRRAVELLGSPTDAEWIVYCFGCNDAAPWKRVPHDEFADNYARLLCRSGDVSQLVLGPPPVIETGQPGSRTNTDLAEYSAIAGDMARTSGAAYVSLTAVIGASDLGPDGVHLNDAGYDIIERIVLTMRPCVDADCEGTRR